MIEPHSTYDIAVRLGLRLRQARVEANLTQALLAARAGVSVRVISRMEQGDTTVSLGRWLKASMALGLLDSWEPALRVEDDPFIEYDRKQSKETDPGKRRVRPRKQP